MTMKISAGILCWIGLVIGGFIFQWLSGRNNWTEVAEMGCTQAIAIIAYGFCLPSYKKRQIPTARKEET